jgi:peptide/nickel transport system permease protein
MDAIETEGRDLDRAFAAVRERSGLAKVRHTLGRLPVLPVSVLVGLFLMAIFADLLAPYDPTLGKLEDRRSPPVWQEEGTTKFILGTDQQGRDLLSRMIHGSRVSLAVAGMAIVLGMTFGTVYGLVSGYSGGWVDEIMMRVVDIFLSIPLIMVALVVTLVVGKGFMTVVGVLVLFSWVPFARQVRAETLQLKALDYVALARVAGASTPRILLRHILPGVVNTIIVISTLNVGYLILTESILSFLGAGIPPPTATWGAMVSDGRNYLASSWWIAFFPGIAIFITVIAFNLFGDWLRDTLDPRLRQMG